MADETKKNSFASRFKKGDGFKGSAAGGGASFASRFRPQKAPTEDSDSGYESDEDSSSSAISKIVKEKKQKKPFSDKKGIKNRAKQKEMSHAEQTRRKRSQNVFLVRGKDRGRAAWHYVLVDNNKREMFLAATRSGQLDVADYGEVLQSGWGEDPPEHVVKKIEEEFNI